MGAKYTLEGDAAGAVKAIGSATKEFEKADKAADKAAAASKRMADAAQRIKESIDPQEKLNRLTRQLAEHVKAGTLSIEQATRAHVKYRDQLGISAKSMQKVGESSDRAFGRTAINNITSYLLGLGSIGGAISLVRSELESIARLDDKAAQRALGPAAAEANLRRVVATDKKRDFVLSEAERIASVNRLPVEGVYDAMTAAYGASSDADLSVATIEAAASRTRDPSKIGDTASGIGFILQSSRIKDAREAGGFLDQVLAESPIKDEKVPQALAKVVGDYVSAIAGGSEASAGAILAGLSQAAGDVEGDRARTGAINLRGQTEAFFKKNASKFGLSPDDVDGLDERLSILFDDKNIAMARQFIKETTFEAPVRGGMATMFLNPEHRARFRENRLKMGSRESRLAADADTSGFVFGGATQDFARTEAGVQSVSDERNRRRGLMEQIITAESRQRIKDLLIEQRGFEIGLETGLWSRTGGSMTRAEAISELEGGLNSYGVNRDASLGDEWSRQLKADTEAMVRELKGIRGTQKAKGSTRQE